MKATSASLLFLIVLGGCEKPHIEKPPPQAETKLAPAQAEEKKTPVHTEIGRYQILFSPHMRADTFLLDTATGKVWQPTEFSAFEGKPTAWKEMTVFRSVAEELEFYKFNKLAKPAAK